MRWQTIVIGVLVATVLLPMWYVGIQGESPTEEIAIDQSVTEIQPLGGFLDTPNKLAPSQVGVIVWIALFGLFGVIVGVHRFMNRAVRPVESGEAVADGGVDSSPDSNARTDGAQLGILHWFRTDERWVVEYRDATEDTAGVIVMGALTVLAITFSALFTGEYLTLARTQYFGVYAAGLFFSLAALTVAYYAWFMPHVKVAEKRSH